MQGQMREIMDVVDDNDSQRSAIGERFQDLSNQYPSSQSSGAYYSQYRLHATAHDPKSTKYEKMGQ